MKKFITANDMAALARKGKTEYVMGPDEQLTDLVKETAKRRGIRLISEKAPEKPSLPPQASPPELPLTELPHYCAKGISSIVEYAEASLEAPPDTLEAFAKSHPNLSESEAVAGYPALGTRLVSVLNEGFFRQEILLEKLIPLMTMNPAKIFGIYPRKGTLLPGSDADLVLVDMNLSRVVEPARLMSRSDFSIFQEKTLRAWPVGTIKAGRIAAWDGRLTDDARSGTLLKRSIF